MGWDLGLAEGGREEVGPSVVHAVCPRKKHVTCCSVHFYYFWRSEAKF